MQSRAEAAPAGALNVPTPNEYDGSPERYQTFIDQLDLCFMSTLSRFPDNKSKIVFALSLMTKGLAAPWRAQILDGIRDGTYILISWLAFKEKLHF
jgi:hypothetical protein